ncbi:MULTISPECIES: MFS transporter [unclassified Rathayibacter]|uniref:MFS transporter n=1 Tax=unclassified Rathayibacter TaxID=2609250 RepID=UPI00188C0079|nr:MULTISPECIES: MFS transporter [unclassified Rathayibacter]MBF4461499.1 MFS transporter [Rathayibacter sp. VKM Ac-2879]MBF4502910.1 MFS transporter [Rathayibacter sp. VKM Ac-2878]
MSAMFRSLAVPNYRIWFAGAMVSNVGTWMQRTAQDWIVINDLTNHDASALGVTMALQFGPPLVMVPFSGFIADRFDRRKLLMATQGAMGTLGLGLGLIVVTGVVQLWMVYLFALVLGFAAAIDAPVRQTFVSALVEERDLSNAVSLNSASFNSARMIGPALAGVLIAAIGSGWVFLLNAASFLAVLLSLHFLHRDELRIAPRASRGPGALLEGFRYVSKRRDIVVVLAIVFLIGTFGLNFPIFASTMATVEFGMGASEFGLLTSAIAVGSVLGALLSARRDQPRLRLIVGAAAAFGLALALASVMPTVWAFAILLPFVGIAAQTLMTSANGYVQLSTTPEMRGRVMALYMAIFMGGTPIGAPLVGWVANAAGPREAMLVGAAAGIVAAAIGLGFHLRLRRAAREQESRNEEETLADVRRPALTPPA